MTINETCSCGASITVKAKSDGNAVSTISQWRKEHQHIKGETNE